MIKKIFFSFIFIIISFNANSSNKITFIDLNFIIEKSNAGTQITEILTKKRDKEAKKLEAKKNSIKKKRR